MSLKIQFAPVVNYEIIKEKLMRLKISHKSIVIKSGRKD